MKTIKKPMLERRVGGAAGNGETWLWTGGKPSLRLHLSETWVEEKLAIHQSGGVNGQIHKDEMVYLWEFIYWRAAPSRRMDGAEAEKVQIRANSWWLLNVRMRQEEGLCASVHIRGWVVRGERETQDGHMSQKLKESCAVGVLKFSSCDLWWGTPK